MSLMQLKRDFQAARGDPLLQTTSLKLHDLLPPSIFGMLDTDYQMNLVRCTDHLLDQVENVRCECNTGNAHAAAAGGSEEDSMNYTGHSYTASKVGMPGGVEVTLLIEGTKWVNPMFSAPIPKPGVAMVSRNSVLNSTTIISVNQCGSFFKELTDIPDVDIKADKGMAELQVQLSEFFFFA